MWVAVAGVNSSTETQGQGPYPDDPELLEIFKDFHVPRMNLPLRYLLLLKEDNQLIKQF